MMDTKKLSVATTLIVLCGLLIHEMSTAQARGRKTLGAVTSDDVVLQWNEIAVNTIGAQPPFPSTRFMATVQVAVFEAVNAISGKYEPYLGTIAAPRGTSTEAAAITAAHGVLKAFFPAAATTLDQQRTDSLALIPDGQAKTDGIAVGESAAVAMIAERTGDGSAPPQFHVPPNSDPYEWQRTPSCPSAGGAFLHWRNVNPFGVQSSSQFRADAPPALTSAEYANDLNEVLALGDINSLNRSQHDADVARIYAAQPPHQGWNSVARQIITTRDDDITDTARILALMNMSLSDAHITVFESKYFYRTWRPETAIPRAAEDGNPDNPAERVHALHRHALLPGLPVGTRRRRRGGGPHSLESLRAPPHGHQLASKRAGRRPHLSRSA